MHIMSTIFANTLVWKHDYDAKLWLHKQRTSNTNEHHTPLNQWLSKCLISTSNGHWIARGSMNNCWGLLEQWSFQFKSIVNHTRHANGVFQPIKQN